MRSFMGRVFDSPLKALTAAGLAVLCAFWAQAGWPAEPLDVRCPAVVRQGDAFTVVLSSPVEFDQVELGWLDRTLAFSLEPGPDGRFREEILLGVDVVQQPGSGVLRLKVAKYGLSLSMERRITIERKAFDVQELNLPSRMVTLSPSDLERHEREKTLVLQALESASAERLWSLPLVRPVPGEVSSSYGLQRIMNGEPRAPHRGVDFRGQAGVPVQAVARGRVLLTGEHFFSGKSVYVDHGQGVVSMYFHLSRIEVRDGEEIDSGQVVGRIGMTGRATGPHLHFGLNILGQSVDPLPMFEAGWTGEVSRDALSSN